MQKGYEVTKKGPLASYGDRPKDWWPTSIMVIAKAGEVELAFVVPSHLTHQEFAKQYPQLIDGLLESLWNSA